MADGTVDDRSDAAGAAPDAGTTVAADAAAAAQGAEGAAGAAPADAGTTDADEVLQISTPAEPKGEGADEADEIKKLKDKLSFAQPRSDALGPMAKRVQELHPEYFDADGNFIGPQEEPAGDDNALAMSRPAGRATEPPPATVRPAAPRPEDGRQPFSVDPNEAWRKQVNADVLASIFGEVEGQEPDALGPIVGVIDARLAQLGMTPDALAKAGGGGMTREQVMELVQSGSRSAVQAYDAEMTSFEARVGVIGAEFGEDFLARTVKFPDRPNMTVKEALPYICAQAGVADPVAAVLVHSETGAAARAALIKAEATTLANQMIAEADGEQLPVGSGGFPGGGVGVSSDIADIGGSDKPLKR